MYAGPDAVSAQQIFPTVLVTAQLFKEPEFSMFVKAPLQATKSSCELLLPHDLKTTSQMDSFITSATG